MYQLQNKRARVLWELSERNSSYHIYDKQFKIYRPQIEYTYINT